MAFELLPTTSEQALKYIVVARPEWEGRFSRCSEPFDGKGLLMRGHGVMVSQDRCYCYLQDDNQPAAVTAEARDCSNIPPDYNNAVNFVRMSDGKDIIFSLAFRESVARAAVAADGPPAQLHGL